MVDPLDRLERALADRYVVERVLGEGGMATVYLARDRKHERQVALKVLRPDLAAVLGGDRFLREIRIAANLQHPHILPLHDSGEADGFLYYVMPFVDGESLRARIAREGELPVADAARMLRDVADALSYAHQQGVVHRDIKPDNVMLSGRHALVTDFGVAKAVSEATGRDKLTTAGIALGTPSYMSPEQAAADPHIDHRADVYALGALAYELLTGRPPFIAATPQAVLAQHISQQPEPIARHRSVVPPHLDSLVMRCLAKKPADRWQTADELIPQFEGLATPSVGLTPTGLEPAATLVARSKRRVLVAGAFMVAITALVVLRGSVNDEPVDVPAVAVLPFEMQGATADDTLLFDAIHSEILTKLFQVPGLRVRARSSVLGYRGAGFGVRKIADRLEVDAVTETTARRVGNQFQITIQLIDGETEQGMWGNSWNTELTARNLFQVQAEIASSIAGEFAAELTVHQRNLLATLPTEHTGAYEAYLDGIAYFQRRIMADDRLRAIASFKRATELDPSFADANAWLARALVNHFWFAATDTMLAVDAWRAAGQARELAPDAVTTHLALGDFHHYTRLDLEEAHQHYERALELAPGDTEALAVLGFLARKMGRWDEGLVLMEQAVAMDPGAASVMVQIGLQHLYFERIDETLRTYDRALARDPALSYVYRWKFLTLLWTDTAQARTYLQEIDGLLTPRERALFRARLAVMLRDLAAADSLLAEPGVGSYGERGLIAHLRGDTAARRRHGDSLRVAVGTVAAERDGWRFRPIEPGQPRIDLAYAYAFLGHRDSALANGMAAVALLPPEEGPGAGVWALQDLAWIRLIVGDYEGALADLKRVRDQPHGYSTQTTALRMHPIYDPIRNDSRFEELLKGWPR